MASAIKERGQRLPNALDYLDRGFSIIPCDAEKKPLIPTWKQFQTVRATRQQVTKWWLSMPFANVAIVTGEISGLTVVDCDSQEAWDAVQELLPESFVSPVVITPTGNRQIYFAYTPGLHSQNNVLPKVDIKTDGGYVIAPGSACDYIKEDLHIVGGHVWLEGTKAIQLPPMPASLFDELEKAQVYTFAAKQAKDREKEERKKPEAERGGDPGTDFNRRATQAEVLAILESDGWQVQRKLEDRLRLTRPGKDPKAGHSATLFNDGTFYGFSTAGSKLKEGESYSPFGLFATIKHGGDFRKAALALLNDGYGQRKLEERQKDDRPPEQRAALDAVQDVLGVQRDDRHPAEGEPAGSDQDKGQQERSQPEVKTSADLRVFNVGEDWLEQEPPPLDPVLEGFVDILQRVAVIGGSKRRKSFIVASMSGICASGISAIGIKAVKPRKTLLVQFEIGIPHMWRRLQRLFKPMGITKSMLGSRLSILNLRDALDDDQFEETALRLIEKAMADTQAEVLIIDPLYVLIAGEENETSAMRKLLRRLGTICRNSKAALIYAHHDKKSGHYDQELANRGSGTGLTARDYDGAMFLSPHESGDEELTVVEFLVRHAPPKTPYCLRWTWGQDFHHFVVTDDAPDKALKAKKAKKDLANYIEKARSIICDWKQSHPTRSGEAPPMMPKILFASKMREILSEREFREFCTQFIFDENAGTGDQKSPIRGYTLKDDKNRKMVDTSLSYKFGS